MHFLHRSDSCTWSTFFLYHGVQRWFHLVSCTSLAAFFLTEGYFRNSLCMVLSLNSWCIVLLVLANRLLVLVAAMASLTYCLTVMVTTCSLCTKDHLSGHIASSSSLVAVRGSVSWYLFDGTTLIDANLCCCIAYELIMSLRFDFLISSGSFSLGTCRWMNGHVSMVMCELVSVLMQLSAWMQALACVSSNDFVEQVYVFLVLDWSLYITVYICSLCSNLIEMWSEDNQTMLPPKNEQLSKIEKTVIFQTNFCAKTQTKKNPRVHAKQN